MDHLRAMRVFLRVAELGSLTAASEDLGYAKGAASAILKELERHLGVQLVERTTRSLRLTEDGRAYAERARKILDDVTMLEDDIGSAERSPRGLLRVQIPPGLARAILAPALPSFIETYPEVEVHILSRNSLPDFVGDRLDAAVFAGEVPDRDLTARSVGRLPVLTVASPAYLAARGAPKVPADLANHATVAILSSATGAPVPWRFREGEEAVVQMPRGPLAFESAEAGVAAASRGGGLLQVASYLVYNEIRSGRLVPVLNSFRPQGVELRILHPRHRLKPRKLRVFEDFLIELNETTRRKWRISEADWDPAIGAPTFSPSE